ncbi:MAG TPA: hypothetical protein VIK33_17855 [Anaerolineae bacterium]
MTDKLIEAIGRCDPEEPLGPDDPRWHDFDPVRGTTLHSRITRRLRGAEAEGKFSHITLAGHRGCGKSTELARVQAEARAEGYLPLYALVNEQADPNEIGFGDLFLLMLRLLDDEFRTNDRLKPLPEKTVKIVTGWFRDVTRIEEQEVERAVEYSGGAGLGIETPLAKLLFGLNVLRKSTGKQREEVKQAVEKYPSQLQQNLNLLLDDAKRIAAKTYPRGPLFILDNLDRYTPEMISDAVLTNAGLFNGVVAHTIFVVPISLMYNPPGETVEDRFEPETLPMLPVFRRSDRRSGDDAALAALTEAIFKRVDRALFADLALAREVARLSGGCPRDLLRLLKEALLESNDRIDARAVSRAASIVRGEMARKLTLAHYTTLAQVHTGDPLDPDETGRFLLYRRAALEYNGERWVGVHPLLWDTPEFKTALDEERRKRGAPLTA